MQNDKWDKNKTESGTHGAPPDIGNEPENHAKLGETKKDEAN